MSTDRLRDIVASKVEVEASYRWELTTIPLGDPASLAAAAAVLARVIINHLCPRREAKWWHDAKTTGTTLAATEAALVANYLEPHFGGPGTIPAVGDHRAAGSVSEFLWLELLRSRTETTRSILRIEGSGFSPTDPGGDGLIIYRTTGGHICFRLWEIKKHEAVSAVTVTVNTAVDQVNERGMSYLGRYTKIAEQAYTNDPDLHRFCSTLVDRWVENDPSAGAGIAVSTSWTGGEADCFTTLPVSFPNLVGGEQLEGLLNAVGSYTHFVELVRGEVWSAH